MSPKNDRTGILTASAGGGRRSEDFDAAVRSARQEVFPAVIAVAVTVTGGANAVRESAHLMSKNIREGVQNE